MLQKGTFPDCLKIAVTSPIFKKGDKLNPGNYRPILLILIVSKIIEYHVHQQMNLYFERNNLISNTQYGFRSKLSTVKAVENIVSDIYDGFEKRLISCATLLDLNKALDTVSHSTLIMKLKYYGMEESAVKLIVSYLSNRVQLVSANGQLSNPQSIKRGVPQGI